MPGSTKDGLRGSEAGTSSGTSATIRVSKDRHGDKEDEIELLPLNGGERDGQQLLPLNERGRNGNAKRSPSDDRSPDRTHKPIPAITVFGRNAPSLYLPALDGYLAALPAPSFSPFPIDNANQKNVGLGMFPPMDKLASTGKSLQDLEYNSSVLPAWRNRNSILGGLANLAIGVTGSSAVSSFYSLQGILDTVQIFALLLSTIAPKSRQDNIRDWKNLFLGTIPNVLALNFGTTLIQSLIFLTVFMAIVAGFLYSFWRMADEFKPAEEQEGLLKSRDDKNGWPFIFVSFVLTVLYLPISTLATHALVWSDDFWPVPNPYLNSTIFPPIVPSLGPSNVFRDPLDFCYTTTMRRNEINYTPYVLIAAVAILCFLTVWFPIKLRRVNYESLPQVGRFTELGKKRTRSELDREYQRLLDRNRQPLSFLYDDYRRGWGAYRSFYLFVKFSALIIISVVNPDNCLFRTLTRNYVLVTRQVVLLLAMFAFFVLQCIWAPFIDPVSNASEWVSRMNYLLTSLAGLGVVTNMPGKDVLNGPVLYIIYIVTYGLSIYFTFINFGWMQRIVKRISGRLDFSIDIFSPHIDLTDASPHLKRRIWQETLSTMFLTSPECKIPADQRMDFAISRDYKYPPYLLNFRGSPAERYAENLKILREIGLPMYEKGLAAAAEYDSQEFMLVQHRVQKQYIGPDCYWKCVKDGMPVVSSFFGTAWWVPFPPTLVLRYDDGPIVSICKFRELQEYISQNQSPEIIKRRQVRLAIRALHGQFVRWPFDHRQSVGRHGVWCCGRRYKATDIIHFETAHLKIKHHGCLIFNGFQLGSGFDVELSFSKRVQTNGDVIGIDSDWEMTPQIARFLALNRTRIASRIPLVESAIQDYRDFCWNECHAKAEILSYQFLVSVYNRVQPPEELLDYVSGKENDLRVRQLMVANEVALTVGFERHVVVSRSEVATWWYIFWDDIWRRNFTTVSAMMLHKTDFDPHYPKSIAYSPLPRATLESFLTQRGLYSSKTNATNIFHSGLLNKIYFRLNGIAFHDSTQAVVFHVGEGSSGFKLDDIDIDWSIGHGRRSSLGTGGGTDHDDSVIRPRPEYRWEGILEDSLLPSKARQLGERWFAKLQVWMGVSPVWRVGKVSKGLALDVKLVDGRYELLDRRV